MRSGCPRSARSRILKRRSGVPLQTGARTQCQERADGQDGHEPHGRHSGLAQRQRVVAVLQDARPQTVHAGREKVRRRAHRQSTGQPARQPAAEPPREQAAQPTRVQLVAGQHRWVLCRIGDTPTCFAQLGSGQARGWLGTGNTGPLPAAHLLAQKRNYGNLWKWLCK